MIELQGISRIFIVGGRPVYALRQVDLSIGDGEYLAIMGPSGSGKSTLLNILGCLDRPTQGTYCLDDQEISELSERQLSLIRRHRIGFVFQFFHLISRLSAIENVEVPMLFAGIGRSKRRQKASKSLISVGLDDRASHRPDQLSGGERQRVAIARATAMSPSIVLADEPTGNLDSSSGKEVIELLEKMNRHGMTLIVVTHDPNIGRRAHRMIRLHDGLIAAEEKNAKSLVHALPSNGVEQ